MQTSPEPTAIKALTMTVPEAAARLGVSLKTFKRLIDAGEVAYVQFVRPNGTRWIEEAELLRLIKKHRVKAHGGPRTSSSDAPAPVAA